MGRYGASDEAEEGELRQAFVSFPRIATLKTAAAFRAHVASLGIELPFDETLDARAHLAAGECLTRGRGTIGNRFAILPMEGWDGELDGRPSELTRRRWQNFGQSGRQADLGRRGGRRASRRPSQSQSASAQ